MTRTLTAAAALAAALGAAGMANAQTNSYTSGPSSSAPSSPMTTSPSALLPGMSGTQNPRTMTAPGETGAHGSSPQANTGQAVSGPQGSGGGQMQIGQATQPQILQAQQQLKSAGLYRGAVDGVMGPETQTALSQFQREQGLPQTSQLDQQTMNRLNGASAGGSQSGTQPVTPSYPAGTQNPATTGGSSTANGSLNGR